MSLKLAQNGHPSAFNQSPVSEVKQTSVRHSEMFALTQGRYGGCRLVRRTASFRSENVIFFLYILWRQACERSRLATTRNIRSMNQELRIKAAWYGRSGWTIERNLLSNLGPKSVCRRSTPPTWASTKATRRLCLRSKKQVAIPALRGRKPIPARGLAGARCRRQGRRHSPCF